MCSKFLFCMLIFCIIFPREGRFQATNSHNEVYTKEEKQALEKFHQHVRNDLYLDYHNSHRFLINWLRNKDLDIPKAAAALRSSLKYRKEHKVDTVLTEEKMLDFHKSYPATFDKAVDKLGNPAYQVTYSKWDIRKAMLTGKSDQMSRYIFFVFESSMAAARRLGATNFIFFTDMSNYNLRQHACLACIPWYIELVTSYERHYPNAARYVILFNTPRIFEAISSIILPLMSPATQKSYKVFGPNKDEWQKFVLQVFDAEQLTKQYGGTKTA